MPHVDANGRSLHYVRAGAGEPLLLIMGMSGHHGSWGERFPGLLAEQFDVIRFDNRGMGRSAAVEEQFTVADMAQDAAGLLDALGIERAHVMGISLGGTVAQELALAMPERVERLVLGCTWPGDGSVPSDMASVALLGEAIASRDVDRILRAFHTVNFAGSSQEPEASYEAHVERAFAHPSPLAVTQLQMVAGALHDAAGRLGGIEAPTLVLHGRKDALIPCAQGEAVARLIPDARLEVLEDCGHLFFIEEPERVAGLVRGHLRS